MRRLLCSISGFVALLSLTHAQAGTFVVSAAAATNTTTQWMPGAGPQFDLGSQVGFAPAPAPFPYLFSSFFKASSAVPAPPATRTVTGPRQTSPTNVNVWGEARNVYNATRTGVFGQNIAYNYTFSAVLTNTPANEFVRVTAWHGDPFGYTVGALNTSLTLAESLFQGTTFQATPVVPGTANLTIDVRVGLGSAFDPGTPSTLWNNTGASPGPPPSGSVDLYQISIEQNAAGTGVTADVIPSSLPSLSGFNLSGTSAAAIASAIDNATWTEVGGMWSLQSNLNNLIQVTLTNTSSNNTGTNFVIGVGTTEAAALPEPSTFLLLTAAIPVALIIGRRPLSDRRKAQTAEQ